MYCLYNGYIKIDMLSTKQTIPIFQDKKLLVLCRALEFYDDKIDYFVLCNEDSLEMQRDIITRYMQLYDATFTLTNKQMTTDKYFLTYLFLPDMKIQGYARVYRPVNIEEDRKLYFASLVQSIRLHSNSQLYKFYQNKVPYTAYILQKLQRN